MKRWNERFQENGFAASKAHPSKAKKKSLHGGEVVCMWGRLHM